MKQFIIILPYEDHVATLNVEWIISHVKTALELNIVMSAVHNWILSARKNVFLVHVMNWT